MPETLVFGSFEFEPDSGTLTRRDPDDCVHTTRLPPQPAQLLSLLLARYPDVLNRDEIRRAIWSEVAVDFDRSLHFCVRQIRVALEESASEPRFIETLPRRGYRWLVEPRPVSASTRLHGAPLDPTANEAVAPSRSSESSSTRERPLSTLTPGLRRLTSWKVGLVAVALGWLWLIAADALRFSTSSSPPAIDSSTGPGVPAVRVAVMPLLPRSSESSFADNRIAEGVLTGLLERNVPRIEVIGPSTTSSYDGSSPRIRELMRELRIDFVVNGKFSWPPAEDRVLVEIIRADGAHVWTAYFQVGDDRAEIAQELIRQVVAVSETQRKTARSP